MKKKEEQEKPIRQISNRGYRKIIGLFSSIKCGRSVRFESLLEMDFIYHLEQDKLVEAYCEQPCKISYYSNNGHRIYVRDFKVHRTDQPRALLIEVKPMEKVVKQVSKLKQIKKAALAEGYDFHIVTKVFIRQEPKLSILKYLHRFATIKVRSECLYAAITYRIERMLGPNDVEARNVVDRQDIPGATFSDQKSRVDELLKYGYNPEKDAVIRVDGNDHLLVCSL